MTGKSRHDFKCFGNKIGLNMREKQDVVCAQVWVHAHSSARAESKGGSWVS